MYRFLQLKRNKYTNTDPLACFLSFRKKESVSSPIPDGIWNKKAKEIGKYYDGSIVELLYVLKTLM